MGKEALRKAFMGVFSRVLEAIDAEGAAALVTILAIEGSSPRDAGARMVVRPSGGFHGTIGGGMLEWEALADARRALAAGRGPTIRETKSLGPDLGQCCGGRVSLMIEIFDARDREQVAALAGLERAGAFETEGVATSDGRLARRQLPAAKPDRHRPETAKVSLLPDGRIVERFGEDATALLLFGAGHVGRALVLALAPLPFAVRWIDSRQAAFPAAVPANAILVHAPSPVAELEAAPGGAFVMVMTHSHPLDLDIVMQALRANRFAHVGLIGSATKRARFASRMRAAGLPGRDIERLVCPIGLPDIAGKEPAVIAASVAADLLVRRERLAASERLPRQPQRARA